MTNSGPDEFELSYSSMDGRVLWVFGELLGSSSRPGTMSGVV
jgi:hypothetical protein